MELGTGLFTCQRRPDDDRSGSEVYDETCTLARVADRSGLDSVWVSEHHFAPDDYLSGTMPALGALARETAEIEIGTCIALAPLYDPVRLAEDAATVDLLSEGRLTLGLAIGSNPREFEAFGVPQEERAERLEDCLSVLRGAWSEGSLGYDATFQDVSPEVDVRPKPGGEIPVMLGGAAKPAVRRAARRAEGWCAPSALSIEGVALRQDDLRSTRAEEGIDGEFTTYVIQHGFVADSAEEAWERMKPGYFHLQRRYAEMFSGKTIEELDADRKRELRDQAIYGTPEEVIEQLETYREALDDDVHFLFRTYHPGIGTDAMAECITRLGEEVAPALR
jgi:alkanesulfonate monooxygenase SsuD/methylene tetrahydromethanopterin reductase-like flavin-dependent oxidoreductase (luciferase family)